MIKSTNNIEGLIPQRPPFVMIDSIEIINKDLFQSSFEIKSDNIFLKDNQFEIYGIIENIAQTTAAGLSLVIEDPDKKPEEGFLGSVSKLVSLKHPLEGESITTSVKLLTTYGNMYKIQGESYSGNELLAQCELKLVGINN